MPGSFLRELTLNFTHSLEAGVILEGPVSIKYHGGAPEVAVAFLGVVKILLTVFDLILAGSQGVHAQIFVEDVRAKLLVRAVNVRLVSIDALGRFKIIYARPGPLGVGCSLERVPG